MKRLLRRIACVAVLGVLSGAPAVAVICAELCAPAMHHEQAESEAPLCHGQSDEGPVMAAEPRPDCADHGIVSFTALASLTASRENDLAVTHPAAVNVVHLVTAGSASSDAWPASTPSASPPRPTGSSPVLRI